jgi:uncharacterized protein YegL
MTTITTRKEPKHVATFSGDQPIIIALDTTASMQAVHIQSDGRTRYQYALERIDELLGRMPRDTRVTIVTFDATAHELAVELTGPQARAALQLVTNTSVPTGATSNHGRALETVLETFHNTRRASARINMLMPEVTVLYVTDGIPDDAWRLEAFLREALRTHVVGSVIVLWVGPDADEQTRSWFGADDHPDDAFKGHVSFLPLTEDTEIRMSTRTQSDAPERAKHPTVPPSISPPKPEPERNALGVGVVTDDDLAHAKRVDMSDAEPRNALKQAVQEMGGVALDADDLQRHIDNDEPLPTVLQDDPRKPAATEYVDPKRHAPEPPAKHGKSTRPSGGTKR